MSFRRALALAAGLLAIVFLLLTVAERASAQTDICDQYPDLPQCGDDGGPGGGGGDPGGGNGGGGGPGGGNGGDPGGGDGGPGSGSEGEEGGGSTGSVGVSSNSGGEIPYTGYPLTSGIIIALLLLGAGLAIRGGLALHERRASSSAGGPKTPPGLT